jgi:hypothetical protein
MKKINYLNSLFENIFMILFLGIVLLVFAVIIRMLEPIWPITSLTFALLITILGLGGARISRALTILGIFLYGLSWYIAYEYHMVMGTFICGLGIITWLAGGFHAFEKNNF